MVAKVTGVINYVYYIAHAPHDVWMCSRATIYSTVSWFGLYNEPLYEQRGVGSHRLVCKYMA